MPVYRTHLIINLAQKEKIEKLSFPEIKLSFINEPSQAYWESPDGRSSSTYFGGRGAQAGRKDEIPLSELLVETSNEAKAEDFISIVLGGIVLTFPDASTLDDYSFISEYKEEANRFYIDDTFFSYLKKIDNVAFGCLITEKCMADTQVIYAIEKFKTSIHLTSFNPRSADPKYGQVFDNYDIKREYHTKAAFAIIAAFSVIEELGLEVRSSSKNVRFLNNETGQWNSKVLSDLQERLQQSNISEADLFDWAYRGNPTRIEQEIRPYFGFDSEWTVYGESVRDKTLTFPEAIHNASYLRNFIASHRFNELTQYISPYDVFNVQMLARELILNKLGLWKAMLTRNKKAL